MPSSARGALSIVGLDGIDGFAEQLEPVVDQAVSQFPGNLALQLLDPLVAELDDAPRLDVDEVIMVIAAGLLYIYWQRRQKARRHSGQK